MLAFEQREAARDGLIDSMIKLVGHPEDGGNKATGLFGLFDGLNGRLGTFEKMRERAKGAAWALGVGIPFTGALTWFLAGDRLTALFHG